jgi:hypothetical protein
MLSNNLENTVEVFYNYPNKSIYRTEFEKDTIKDGYMKMTYSSNSPNITLSTSKSNTNYTATNLYIFQGSNRHRITKYDYQAIMVIEHNPTTNGFRKLYTCFPLATTGAFSPIDKLIIGQDSVELNLNNLIKGEIKTALYENKGIIYNDIVVIFDKPIYVTSALDQFSTGPTMFSELSHIKDIPCGGMREEEGVSSLFSAEDKIREGMTDVPVYCTPIDELEDAKEFSKQIVMPVIGSFAESLKAIQIFYYAINFVTFFLVLIISYFVVPLIYLYGFAAKIVQHTDIDNLKTKNCSPMPFYIFIILLLIGDILLFSVGSGSNESNNFETYYAMTILLMICLFFLIIRSKSENIYDPWPDFLGNWGNIGGQWHKPFIGLILGGLSVALPIAIIHRIPFSAAIFFITGSIGYVFGCFLVTDNLLVDE